MNRTVAPGPRMGLVRAPVSKSQAHRLLICAALGERPVEIGLGEPNDDIAATAACLRALGAAIEEIRAGVLRVGPIEAVPAETCVLPCGESGSTLRFLLPVAGALGAAARFERKGRLPQRPIEPLGALLRENGMALSREGDALLTAGQLRAGDWALPGNVSSQYISGMLLAAPLLSGDSTLTVTGPIESAGYLAMTEAALAQSHIAIEKDRNVYRIRGGQRYALPQALAAEGDWSGAAFFLAMGALSEAGVTVSNLSAASAQGDRAIVPLLRQFGAEITQSGDAVTVRRRALRGIEIDAAPIPDLVPALAAVAAAAAGETRIDNAGRLRLKESDRLQTTAQLLRALGAEAEERGDTLTVRGGGLSGGAAEPCGDHRIAMAAAVAACACREAVTIAGAECVRKSYPRFWDDLDALKGALR